LENPRLRAAAGERGEARRGGGEQGERRRLGPAVIVTNEPSW